MFDVPRCRMDAACPLAERKTYVDRSATLRASRRRPERQPSLERNPMKNVLACCLVLSSVLGAGHARAIEYVCEISLNPPVVDPTRGNFGYVSMYTSQQPNCAGQTATYSICSKGATSHSCGVTAQYSEPALISLFQMLRSAEVEQHPVVAFWSACIAAGGSCTGGILLYPDL
jgi:hypothetical protein